MNNSNMNKGKKKHWNLSLRQKEGIMGYVFNLPFIIGFIFLFLVPFVQSIIFSLSSLSFGRGGYELEFIGLENFRHILFVDVNFMTTFIETVRQMITDVPIILIFSFFAALILNHKIKGRLIFLLIFFLPVIYGAGAILHFEQGDPAMQMYLTGGDITTTTQAQIGGEELELSVNIVRRLLINLQLPRQFTQYIIYAIDHIAELIRASGIQILIFLAGLRSISESLYEASKVEGANAWQNFWLITLPILSPLVLTNVVYTVIDSFTAVNRNPLMGLINEFISSGGGYGRGTAMSWFYLLSVFLYLGVIVFVVSRFVFYQE